MTYDAWIKTRSTFLIFAATKLAPYIERYHPRRSKKYSLIEKYFISAIKDNGQIQIVSAFQKSLDKEFVDPLQGKWIHNVDKLNAKEKTLNYLKQPNTFQKFHS
jgi:hypothetical protein